MYKYFLLLLKTKFCFNFILYSAIDFTIQSKLFTNIVDEETKNSPRDQLYTPTSSGY